MTSDLGPAPTTGDAWRTIGLVALAMVSQCVAWSAFNEADGDWMRFIGGGGRSPAVPMWVTFGIWTFLTFLGLLALALYVRLVVRFAKSQHRNQAARKALGVESID